MRRLTPQLFAVSTLDAAAVGADVTATRELDFNLARRSAVVINKIIGYISLMADTTTGFGDVEGLVQEVDLDPDNDGVINGACFQTAVVIDSSRVFRQHHSRSLDTAAGTVSQQDGSIVKDWTNLPIEQRPISITNLRHHLRCERIIACNYYAEVDIDYFIMELELWELGIINAGRR